MRYLSFIKVGQKKKEEKVRNPSFIAWLAGKRDEVVKCYTKQSRKWGNNVWLNADAELKVAANHTHWILL